MGNYFFKPHFSDWINTVTQQVRFAPDRKAIEQELTVVVLTVFLAIREHQSPARPSPWQRTLEELAYPAPPASAARRDVPGGTVYIAFEEETSADAETGNTIYSVDLWCQRDGVTTSNFSPGMRFADDQGPIDDKVQPQYGFLPAPQPSPYWTVDQSQDSDGWLRSHRRLLLVLDHEPAWFEISVPYGEAPWSLRCNRKVTP